MNATQAAGTLEPERREEIEIPEAEESGGIPTRTVAGEHLTRASPVAVSAHEEEIVIGEEEGPSEAIQTNEPVVRLGEKAVKQDIIEEERVVEGNLTVGVAKAVPGDLPLAEPVVETEEVLVKQEWVEQCEQ